MQGFCSALLIYTSQCIKNEFKENIMLSEIMFKMNIDTL